VSPALLETRSSGFSSPGQAIVESVQKSLVRSATRAALNSIVRLVSARGYPRIRSCLQRIDRPIRRSSSRSLSGRSCRPGTQTGRSLGL
jgi:hypothetical protein